MIAQLSFGQTRNKRWEIRQLNWLTDFPPVYYILQVQNINILFDKESNCLALSNFSEIFKVLIGKFNF